MINILSLISRHLEGRQADPCTVSNIVYRYCIAVVVVEEEEGVVEGVVEVVVVYIKR